MSIPIDGLIVNDFYINNYLILNHADNISKVKLNAMVDGVGTGADAGGKLIFQTKEESGLMTEKLTINNKGAIGLGATPEFGTNGQILISKGNDSQPEWSSELNTSNFVITSPDTIFRCIAAESGSNATYTHVQMGEITIETERWNNGMYTSINNISKIICNTLTSNSPAIEVNTQLDVNGYIEEGPLTGGYMFHYAGSGPNTLNNWTLKFGISVTHGIKCDFVYAYSDDRIKHNEIDISNNLSVIRQLKPKIYQKTTEMYAADYVGEISGKWSLELGLIAQDVLAIPELSFCVMGGDYTDDTGNLVEEKYSLNYNDIFVAHIAATKELDTIVQTQQVLITTLEARIATLEARVTAVEALEARIAALEQQ